MIPYGPQNVAFPAIEQPHLGAICWVVGFSDPRTGSLFFESTLGFETCAPDSDAEVLFSHGLRSTNQTLDLAHIRQSKMAKKLVYFYGGGKSMTDGDRTMREILGGKGANLAEMANAGVPVPAGFTISTEACADFEKTQKLTKALLDEVKKELKKLEKLEGKKLGDKNNPLLVSVRSGAAQSMPGMMDTVLNLGMNDQSVQGFIKKTGSARAGWDCYRRFIDMFGDVVMGVHHEHFEEALTKIKKKYKAAQDTDLTGEQLEELVGEYKKIYKKHVGSPFPQDPMKQLENSIKAVFNSWQTERAVKYRVLNKITGLIGTAVNVQTMAFGNAGCPGEELKWA